MPHFQDTATEYQAAQRDLVGNYRDSQVKGRVVTTMTPVNIQIGYGIPRPGFEVKQVIDGVVTHVETFATRLAAADDYAMFRAHARRNLHEYLSSSRPESSFTQEA